MEYLLPPLEPKGHDESELFQDFFDHSPYDVAMRASSVMQLQCPLKFRTLERMAALFPDSSDQNWWEIGGVDEFEQVCAYHLLVRVGYVLMTLTLAVHG